MSYRNGLFYLGSKTRVLELCNQFGGRVIVCPEWNGRVMTSTCDGLDGGSFGLINVKAIDSEEVDDSFAFYGGEDQLTLSPEGGPFSLYYATIAGDKFSGPPELLAMPTGYREGAFSVDSLPQDPEVRMRRTLKMTNLAGMQFDLDLVRTVHLLAPREISGAFGDAVAVTLEQADVDYVAFSCSNTMINRGAAHSKLSGLVSLRLRSMFNSGQNTIAVIPYRRGSDEELGPAVCTDFFGSAPHGRIRMLPQAALLRADSKYRCQVGISRRRAMPCLGAIDFREGTLTLVTFELPRRPWEENYLCNAYCETVSNTTADFVNAREFYLSQTVLEENLGAVTPEEHAREEALFEVVDEETPYSGEVVRAYNHGPTIPGEEPTSRFFEFDIFSPARSLVKGESLTHRQYTLHISADNRTLAFLVRNTLGVEYEQVFEKMIR